MIIKGIAQLNNVAELFDLHANRSAVTHSDLPTITPEQQWHGLRMQRVPEELRPHLNDRAKLQCLTGAGMEIRFVADGPVHLTLSMGSVNPDGSIPESHMLDAFAGDIRVPQQFPVHKNPTTITLEPRADIQELKTRLEELQDAELPAGRTLPTFNYDLGVTRVVLPHHSSCFNLHNITPAPGVRCRPPQADELPRKRMLAYGTSITQGSAAGLSYLTYTAECARHLGVQLTNLGMSGSCFCEPAFADYIAEQGQQDAWDFAALALSVNMQHFTQEEFRKRVFYLVDRIAGANPTKPIFVITLWPFWRDAYLIPTATMSEDQEQVAINDIPNLANRMRQDLRDAVAASNNGKAHRNLRILEGQDLFGPFSGLCADLIHPSDHGMIEMGRNLANAVRPHL